MTTLKIITIGTELLLGETADTNTRFLARILRGLGVEEAQLPYDLADMGTPEVILW